MRIDAVGNVGIGTTSPHALFHVAGDKDDVFDSSFVVTSAGKVGIGTTSPDAKLVVEGQVKITGGNPAIGRVLTSDAVGLSTWSELPVISVNGSGNIASSGGAAPIISFTGILPIANGGTAIGTIGAAGTIIYSNGTQHVSTTGAGFLGQVLTSAGGGMPTWSAPTAGTLTAVTGAAPIISSGGNAPEISLPQASTSVDGYLSAADWYSFNSKVSGGGMPDYLARWTSSNNLTYGTIYDNGTNVGIGTASPHAKLEVQDGCVLFEGAIGSTPVNGSGTRMMWIPAKAAFRAGGVDGGAAWDDANIGTSSVAFGYSTKANGDFSSAFGRSTKAQSYGSFVIGRYNMASGTPGSWVTTEPLFVIGNGDHINPNNAMTVLKNGNVGILTVTPKNKLDVQGGIAIGSTYAGIKVAPLNGAIIFGKVGIGTATPTEKLDVVGNIKVNLFQIYFKDSNHGLGYFNAYAGDSIDGPVLYGYTGGALGTKQGGNQKIALYWNSNGNVGIGTDLTGSTFNASYKLAVNGGIRAKFLKVEPNWADFVFEKNYALPAIEDVEQYIKKYGHLPEIPTAEEIKKDGADVGELLKLQMQKIEELTLYVIQLQKEINNLKKN